MSLTSPLGLMRHVRRPNLRLEVVPWLNVLAVGWLMTLLGSSYIYAPGLATGVGAPNIPAHLALPETAGQPALQHIDATLTILPPYYYLEDGRHYKADLPKSLADFVQRANRQHLVLLVKMNDDISVQTYTEVCKMALTAGFETVEVAEIPASDQDAQTPVTPSPLAPKNP